MNSKKLLLPIILLFIIINTILLLFKNTFTNKGIAVDVLLGANILFLITALLVFFMQKKALANTNPNVFIRSVIAGMMIKMFSTVLAVLAYVTIVGSTYNKKAVFISLFIYLFYLAAEVATISKLNKKPNA